ncbi:hypothetical protein G6F32_016359 [Rhizopus arrhizus]|nr:hypothetical protein G6F32_016359 [Rhizopus arrhizus]
MGNEQLRQAREDIATRDAEIGELKQRVADLEKLKEQQQSLIAMKDNDLAAAQQRLAQAPGSRDAATPCLAAAPAQAVTVAAAARRRRCGWPGRGGAGGCGAGYAGRAVLVVVGGVRQWPPGARDAGLGDRHRGAG